MQAPLPLPDLVRLLLILRRHFARPCRRQHIPPVRKPRTRSPPRALSPWQSARRGYTRFLQRQASCHRRCDVTAVAIAARLRVSQGHGEGLGVAVRARYPAHGAAWTLYAAADGCARVVSHGCSCAAPAFWPLHATSALGALHTAPALGALHAAPALWSRL